MVRFLVFLLLVLISIIPIGVIAYSTPQDLLKIEKAPPLDSSLLYKFRIDPKQSIKEKESMMSLWGGPTRYKDCVRLSKEDRLVYLVYLHGITDPSLIESELAVTETFSPSVSLVEEVVEVKVSGFKTSMVSSMVPKSSKISNSLEKLRSKGLVK